MAEEYKKYDSHIDTDWKNARLAKDPQVIEGGERPLVKLTAVSTSRSERHSDMWWEIAVNDRQADFAKYLRKGDTISLNGFPALRRWGDGGEKFSLELVRAELFPSQELWVKVKERGFVPGAGGKAKAPPKRAGKKHVDLDDEDLPG